MKSRWYIALALTAMVVAATIGIAGRVPAMANPLTPTPAQSVFDANAADTDAEVADDVADTDAEVADDAADTDAEVADDAGDAATAGDNDVEVVD